MKAEILMIGTELLIGQIHDTNATHIAKVLAENGIHLYQKTTVGDNPERIQGALDNALKRSDVVLCSGGLGPTEDDITRECIGDLLGRPLEFREELFNAVLERFKHLKARVTENNKKQATLPVGAIAIDNPNGTAPGLIVEDDRGIIICMPGVPHELKSMLDNDVLPYLRTKFGLRGTLHYRVLKVCGLGESRVDDLIGDIMQAQSNPTVGLLANPAAVRIRIAAHATSREEAEALIAPVEAAIRERLEGLIMGVDEDTIEGVVDGLLQAKGWRLSVVEEATGGLIAQRLTAAGSRAFAQGLVLTQSPVPDANTEHEALIDFASEHLVGSGADCSLVTSVSTDGTHTLGAFVCPEGHVTWKLGRYPDPARNQFRAAIHALEHVRRLLTGYKADTRSLTA
jgi:nicotinamide-nucleotide amidase